MKIALLSFFLSLVVVFESNAFTSAPLAASVVTTETVNETVTKNEKPASFKSVRKATEKKLGRKLKLMERLGLWYYTTLPDTDPDQKKTNTKAVLGFAFGIASLVIFPLLSIPGFIFSNNALNKEKSAPGTLEPGNKTLAKIGLILSIVGFVYLLLVVLYIILLFSWGWGWGW